VILRFFNRIGRPIVAVAISFVGVVAWSSAASALPPPGMTVTFHNNAPGSNLEVMQTDNTSASLQGFSTMGFSNSNYFFEDWNTQPNGSGTSFSDQAIYPFTADVDLYAQWIQVTHSVLFYENLSGTDLTNAVQTGNAPQSLSSEASLNIVYPNHTFEDWNTARDGSGAAFSDQAIYSFVADLSLYAQWKPETETLLFSANSGSGSISPITVTYGTSANLPSGSSLSKSGSTMIGWNTAPDGSGTEYQPGAQITVSAGETFYAMWSRDTYTISFVVPGGSAQTAAISVSAGTTTNLPAAPKSSKPNNSFAGWFTSATGGQLAGMAGATYTATGTITLYAQWTSKATVGLEFSDNGGFGHIPARTVSAGSAVIIPAGTGLHRAGYIFRGWASTPRASISNVRIGSRLILTRTKILYALWRRVLPATTPQVLVGSIGIFSPNSSVVTAAMRHEIALTAIGINQRNRTMVLIYGYATSKDSGHGSALLSLQRALAVEKQLNRDLVGLNDVGVIVHAKGEGRLTNSVLASFRKVEIFAN